MGYLFSRDDNQPGQAGNGHGAAVSPWRSPWEPSLGSWYGNGIFLGYVAILTLNVWRGES